MHSFWTAEHIPLCYRGVEKPMEKKKWWLLFKKNASCLSVFVFNTVCSTLEISQFMAHVNNRHKQLHLWSNSLAKLPDRNGAVLFKSYISNSGLPKGTCTPETAFLRCVFACICIHLMHIFIRIYMQLMCVFPSMFVLWGHFLVYFLGFHVNCDVLRFCVVTRIFARLRYKKSILLYFFSLHCNVMV